MDLGDGQPSDEEILLGVNYQNQHQILDRFLRAYIESTPGLFMPFIVEDGGNKYNSVPEDFQKEYDAICEAELVAERDYSSGEPIDEPNLVAKQIDEPKPKPEDE